VHGKQSSLAPPQLSPSVQPAQVSPSVHAPQVSPSVHSPQVSPSVHAPHGGSVGLSVQLQSPQPTSKVQHSQTSATPSAMATSGKSFTDRF
jgi:hypothetical protein